MDALGIVKDFTTGKAVDVGHIDLFRVLIERYEANEEVK